MTTEAIARAAELIRSADGLLITAGAGMGVDSGLPDFRGQGGFWKHYPALGRAKIGFTAIACPEAFLNRPKLAWGFYGHRLNLYRATVPHAGFQILRRWAERMPHGSFVFTSNVDGQFQKAGFQPDRISEVHGSIHHLQCIEDCKSGIWRADDFDPEVDEENCLLTSDPPACPHCGGMARPNILMFGDWGWLDDRAERQQMALIDWRQQIERLVVVELGAGTDIPTVRMFGESIGGRMIRINPQGCAVPWDKAECVELGALQGLRQIDACLSNDDGGSSHEP